MVREIHEIIRRDIMSNVEDLFKLRHHYTHKYRSNDRMLDINVGLFRNDKQQLTAQIYVADKYTKIREQFFLDDKNVIVNNQIIIKTNE